MLRAAVLALVAAAVVALASLPALAAQVVIGEGGVQPRRVRVDPGEPVVWTNAGDEPVVLDSSDAGWSSGPIAPGATFSLTFERPGVQRYESRDGTITGTIVVGDAAGSAAGGDGRSDRRRDEGGGRESAQQIVNPARPKELADTGLERFQILALAGGLLAAGGTALLLSERAAGAEVPRGGRRRGLSTAPPD